MKLLSILIFTNLFFLQSYLIRFGLFGYPSNLQEILIALTAIVFLAVQIKNRQLDNTLKNLLNYKVILFFLIGGVIFSILPPIENHLDLIRYLKFIAFGSLLAFITLETFQTDAARKKALIITGLGALTFGLFSLIYNLTGHNVALDLRLLGPLDAAVYLAYYLTPFFLFFTCETIRKPNTQYLLITITLGLLVLLTQSMGSIAGSFIIIALYLFLQNKNRLHISPKTKALIIVSAILISAAIFYTKILPTLTTTNSSFDERGEIWQTSMHLLKQPEHLLLGLGLGQFQENYAATVTTAIGHEPLDYIVLQPHNIFFLAIFNFGIIGLLALLYLLYHLCKNLQNWPQKNQSIRIATLLTLYFLLHGLIDTPYFKNDLLFLFILFAEMALLKPTHKIQ